MTPSARLAAVIELIGEIEASIARKGPAADVVIQRYFRQRRYAGSKDRQAIIAQVWRAVRQRGEYGERLTRAGASVSPRLLALLDCRLTGIAEEGLHEGAHAVSPPDEAEAALLERAASRTDLSLAGRLNVPAWLAEKLKARFGGRVEAEIGALSGRAPVDLRVNSLRTDRARLLEALKADGIEAEPCRYSPLGIRLETPAQVQQLAAFRHGDFEVQDEASQIAALLSGVGPKLQVAELCAGAGGKTLAFGAMMKNSGQIFAMDVDKRRLEELKERGDRAHLTNLQIHRITTGVEKRADQLARFKGQMDIVVVDAPCSGSGAWRRNPELRWRHEEEDIRQLATAQRALLREAMALAKPDGRVVYMTCSILREENEAVIGFVLRTSPEWEIEDYRRNVEAAGLAHLPESRAEDARMLQMTPLAHDMDGFFLALLQHR